MRELIEWYKLNKRDLPWRNTSNPYYIWISEIMLQQTTVAAVIPYFNRFIEKYPTVEILANAKIEEVLKMWEGLGYYSRARNIHFTANMIVDNFQGVFPRKYEDILSLKGIGPYTAGAISSIAYNEMRPAVDGNVFRVMSRYKLIWDDISKPKTRRVFEDAVMEEIKEPSIFNQAIMDLGATICTPKHPKCMGCPLKNKCEGYLSGVEEELPIKTSKTKQVKIPMLVGIIENEEGLLMRQRPETGMLARMYELIQTPGLEQVELIHHIKTHYDVTVKSINKTGDYKHVFSHRIWLMEVFHIHVETNERMYSFKEVDELPISTAHKKILNDFM